MKKARIEDLDFEKGGGLIPAIVQEYKTRKVLMLAYMNREALEKTLETGLAHYYSRSRRRLWMKGETSGSIQRVRRIYVDCDGDAILLQVEQVGDACHLGEHSCFHRALEEAERLHQSFDREVAEKIRGDYSRAEVTARRWVKDKKRKEYKFILTPYTEHYTPPDPEVYEWIAEKIDESTPDIDKVVAPECFGIPIAQLVASRKGRPLAIIRKRPLKPGDKGVEYASGYEKGRYYIYGVAEGEKVLLVDDTVSTGGTLLSLIRELASRGIRVAAVATIASKEDYRGRELVEKLTGLKVQSIVRVYIRSRGVEVEVVT
ncbi:MAG: phosphoribosyl-AMP cyclohydrolase [Thermoproteota archaeon]|nr:MAG: phosphoribosyl-AMP cyclohydrolase [Candidatus Korarchaeota archaeon]